MPTAAPAGRTAKRPWFFVAAIAYMVLIHWASSQPRIEGGPRIYFFELVFSIPYADKVVHFVEYAILGLLWGRATGSALLATVIASGYGLVDELHQRYVPGREAGAADWIADLLGGAAGAWLGAAGVWRTRPAPRDRRESGSPLSSRG